MSAWFNNPQELFNEKKLKSFWPTATQTVGERVNASTRFIIYACVILFVIQKDPRVLVMGGVSIGILYAFWQSKIISDPVLRPAQADGRGPRTPWLMSSCPTTRSTPIAPRRAITPRSKTR